MSMSMMALHGRQGKTQPQAHGGILCHRVSAVHQVANDSHLSVINVMRRQRMLSVASHSPG
ncbi:hypothetical protein [Pseudorhodoferax sp. Leaf265]|uniref:hypothetical protein n=1 Tax=Pseudorhodoferax sp. Leaf265 TaxID=1736315 RepID=UPI0012E7B60C|nr:hypothetical protein [Pseudorhodoferax sp. Leaf265]